MVGCGGGHIHQGNGWRDGLVMYYCSSKASVAIFIKRANDYATIDVIVSEWIDDGDGCVGRRRMDADSDRLALYLTLHALRFVSGMRLAPRCGSGMPHTSRIPRTLRSLAWHNQGTALDLKSIPPGGTTFPKQLCTLHVVKVNH